jgi:hypothetical protein
LEKIIRSIHAALRDNACAEFVFILQFFIHRSEIEGAEIFTKVFQPTLKALLVSTLFYVGMIDHCNNT